MFVCLEVAGRARGAYTDCWFGDCTNVMGHHVPTSHRHLSCQCCISSWCWPIAGSIIINCHKLWCFCMYTLRFLVTLGSITAYSWQYVCEALGNHFRSTPLPIHHGWSFPNEGSRQESSIPHFQPSCSVFVLDILCFYSVQEERRRFTSPQSAY